MEIVALVVFVFFFGSIVLGQVKSHEHKIRKRLHLIGGELIRIEKYSSDESPFLNVKRLMTVYRVEYLKDNETKEGWVKFGALFGIEWRL